MDEQTVVHSYNGALQNKEDNKLATHHSMDEFDKHDADCKKPHTKANILYGFMYIKFIKKKKKKLIYNLRS